MLTVVLQHRTDHRYRDAPGPWDRDGTRGTLMYGSAKQNLAFWPVWTTLFYALFARTPGSNDAASSAFAWLPLDKPLSHSHSSRPLLVILSSAPMVRTSSRKVEMLGFGHRNCVTGWRCDELAKYVLLCESLRAADLLLCLEPGMISTNRERIGGCDLPPDETLTPATFFYI